MKNLNLKHWRDTSDVRSHLNNTVQEMEGIIRENDELKRMISEQRQEIIEELREELDEQYAERLSVVEKERDNLKRKLDDSKEEVANLDRMLTEENRKHEEQLQALRRVLGVSVTNIGGDYIETQNQHHQGV